MTEILCRGSVFALYGQVALLSDEPDAYPQWETGAERAIFGQKGIAVATAPDTDIDVIVCIGEQLWDLELLLSGEIKVGSQGLEVGNEISCDLYPISFPPGRIAVSVYANESSGNATQVAFVLDARPDSSFPAK